MIKKLIPLLLCSIFLTGCYEIHLLNDSYKSYQTAIQAKEAENEENLNELINMREQMLPDYTIRMSPGFSDSITYEIARDLIDNYSSDYKEYPEDDLRYKIYKLYTDRLLNKYFENIGDTTYEAYYEDGDYSESDYSFFEAYYNIDLESMYHNNTLDSVINTEEIQDLIDITYEMTSNLKQLTLNNITELEGLIFFPNLEELYLTKCNGDAYVLKSLSKLKKLTLSGCKIDNIDKVESLEELSIYNDDYLIKLGNFPNLHKLECNDCDKLIEIGNYPKLAVLEIEDCEHLKDASETINRTVDDYQNSEDTIDEESNTPESYDNTESTPETEDTESSDTIESTPETEDDSNELIEVDKEYLKEIFETEFKLTSYVSMGSEDTYIVTHKNDESHWVYKINRSDVIETPIHFSDGTIIYPDEELIQCYKFTEDEYTQLHYIIKDIINIRNSIGEENVYNEKRKLAHKIQIGDKLNAQDEVLLDLIASELLIEDLDILIHNYDDSHVKDIINDDEYAMKKEYIITNLDKEEQYANQYTQFLSTDIQYKQ